MFRLFAIRHSLSAPFYPLDRAGIAIEYFPVIKNSVPRGHGSGPSLIACRDERKFVGPRISIDAGLARALESLPALGAIRRIWTRRRMARCPSERSPAPAERCLPPRCGAPRGKTS